MITFYYNCIAKQITIKTVISWLARNVECFCNYTVLGNYLQYTRFTTDIWLVEYSNCFAVIQEKLNYFIFTVDYDMLLLNLA